MRVALAVALIEVDSRVSRELLAEYPRLFGAGAEGSRGMLAAIASLDDHGGGRDLLDHHRRALAGLEPVHTAHPPQLHERPREPAVLGVFVGIFTYCLVVLRTIRGGDEGASSPRWPWPSASCSRSSASAFSSSSSTTSPTSIQASSVIASAAEETRPRSTASSPKSWAGADEDGDGAPEADEPAGGAWRAGRRALDGLRAERGRGGAAPSGGEHGDVLRMERGVGEFVVEGSRSPRSRSRSAPDERGGRTSWTASYTDQSLPHGRAGRRLRHPPDRGHRAQGALAGRQRHDDRRDLRGLPVGDLRRARRATRRDARRYRADGGELRVIARGPTFESLVDESFDQIRQSAEGNVAVIVRLLAALERVAGRTTDAAAAHPRRRSTRSVAATLADAASQSAYDRAHIDAACGASWRWRSTAGADQALSRTNEGQVALG